MALPDRKAMMRPILTVLSDGRTRSSVDIKNAVAAHFSVSQADLHVRAGKSSQDRFTNEHAFALVDLQRRGLIEKPIPRQYYYRITGSGRTALDVASLPPETSAFEPKRHSAATFELPSFSDAQAHETTETSSTADDHGLGAASSPIQPTAVVAGSESGRAFETPYRQADGKPTRSSRDPFPFDPQELERKTLEHMELQDTLAEFARTQSFKVLSPGPADPVDFDVAWEKRDGTLVIAEIKTLSNTSGESKQLRLGLGQVLDYKERCSIRGIEARAVLVVDRKPAADHWESLCAGHGVRLVWAPELAAALLA